MTRTARWFRPVAIGLAFCTWVIHTQSAGPLAQATRPVDVPDGPPKLGPLLRQDDFRAGLAHWRVELERPATISATEGVLDVDVPGGATLWFEHELRSPVIIVFEVTAVAAGGPNDRVSDVNCFWMARNRDGSAPYDRRRSGTFADYHDLLTYYVGLGGNANTTTRFRRYIGDPVVRPLLPEHDLSARETLLVPNRKQTITLVANGPVVEYWRDGQRLFHYTDSAPYVRGWFALRTVQSHLRVERFRIHAMANAATPNRLDDSSALAHP